MKTSIEPQVRKGLFCLKAFAILSVIAAHTVSVSADGVISQMLTSFWVMYGHVGVICFFILGGFFYHRTTGDSKLFWKKKAHSLVIPWLLCATLTYCLAVLRSKEPSILQWMKWVVGSGSWYYYISIFLLYLFVFKYVYNRDTLLIVSLFITPAALLMKTLNPQPDPTGFITNYLNPMYWISYFALGIAIKKYDLMRLLRTKKVVLAAGSLALLSGAFLYANRIFTYFHIVSVIYELSMFVILLHISMWLVNFRVSSALETVGKRTFFIYLLHMQIVQMIDSRLPALLFFEISMPILGVVLMMLLADVGMMISIIIPFGKRLCAMVGLKE